MMRARRRGAPAFWEILGWLAEGAELVTRESAELAAVRSADAARFITWSEARGLLRLGLVARRGHRGRLDYWRISGKGRSYLAHFEEAA